LSIVPFPDFDGAQSRDRHAGLDNVPDTIPDDNRRSSRIAKRSRQKTSGV
jgi:hypothetical protein